MLLLDIINNFYYKERNPNPIGKGGRRQVVVELTTFR